MHLVFLLDDLEVVLHSVPRNNILLQMLEHLRQYGKAQVKVAEAAAQMALMRDLEVSQSAKITKLVPEVASVWDVSDFE